MADEPKTDGTGSATGTQAPSAQKATNGGDDTPAGVQARIDGLTAEKNRLKAERDDLKTKFDAQAEQHKTESQKQIDAAARAIVEAEWKPKGDRLAAMESLYKADVDALLAKIPEQHKDAVDQTAPIEVQRKQAQAIVAAFEAATAKISPQKIASGASPKTPDAKQEYSHEQWIEFQNMAREDPNGFQAIRDEMYAAAREGRVAGLRGAVGPR